mgnify:CR=1 FL=1
MPTCLASGLRTVVSNGNLSVLRTVGFRYTESCGKRLVPGGNACRDKETAEECLPLIAGFVERLRI